MDNNIIWKDIIIDGIITNYEVSNTGLVRNKTKGNILKPWEEDAYLQVHLSIKGKLVHKTIHRLVAKAFIPNDEPEIKTDINHINGCKHDNRIENLEWCTKIYNMEHASRIGLRKTKYSNNTIHLICKMLEKNIPMKLICILLNTHDQLIRDIKNGRNRKSELSQYNINYKEKYNFKNIKYKKLKNILINLNIFNNIDLLELLYSKYIIKKKQLLEDLENRGYEIFIDSKLYKEFQRDYKDEN